MNTVKLYASPFFCLNEKIDKSVRGGQGGGAIPPGPGTKESNFFSFVLKFFWINFCRFIDPQKLFHVRCRIVRTYIF